MYNSSAMIMLIGKIVCSEVSFVFAREIFKAKSVHLSMHYSNC